MTQDLKEKEVTDMLLRFGLEIKTTIPALPEFAQGVNYYALLGHPVNIRHTDNELIEVTIWAGGRITRDRKLIIKKECKEFLEKDAEEIFSAVYEYESKRIYDFENSK
jgi:hypothetical protein